MATARIQELEHPNIHYQCSEQVLMAYSTYDFTVSPHSISKIPVFFYEHSKSSFPDIDYIISPIYVQKGVVYDVEEQEAPVTDVCVFLLTITNNSNTRVNYQAGEEILFMAPVLQQTSHETHRSMCV